MYKRVSNSNIYDSSLTKLLYFDKNNRLLKTEEIGTFNGNEINITIFFTYTNTIKNEMIIEDLINQKKSKFIYKNIKLDQNANSIYEELFDDNEIFQLKIEREFEYY